ncbi:MAG: hypothetical protein HY081_07260 [Gammaproteobacteria bacterium]|nr:hypothetical protein [Gammaproteobacteria bacterium]
MKNLSEVTPTLLNRLPHLAACWRGGEIDAAMFAAMYLLTWQMALHGPQFASRKSKLYPRPEIDEWFDLLTAAQPARSRERLLNGFERYQFRGVIGNISTVIVQWLRGAWPLIVHEDIPPPRSVLAWQARGTRTVTMLTDGARIHQPVLHKRNAYEFFMHDLEHAYKFFYAPALYAGQCAFFQKLEAAVDCGVFAKYLDDVGFKEKFYYLMSDMNTHPQHSRQYLRAILIEFYLRAAGEAMTAPLTVSAEQEIEDILHVATITPLEAPLMRAVSTHGDNNYAETLRDL